MKAEALAGQFEGEVTDFALPDAAGVTRFENRVVFVPGVLPGERVQVEIVKRKKNFFLGKALVVHRTSPDRISPPCPHYLSGCGGCSLQEINYPEQVRIKARHARETLSRVAQVDWNQVADDGFTASPQEFEYRNKMEFNFGVDQSGLMLGLRPRGRWWDVVDLQSCLLMKQEMTRRVLRIFREYGRQHDLPGFDPVRRKGVLRNVLVRLSQKDQGVLIGVFTTPCDLPALQDLIDRLRADLPTLKGLVHITSESTAGALVFDQTEVLWGESVFTDRIGPVDYQVSLSSFFQVNTQANHLVYERVRTVAEPDSSDHLLDLYCGSGGIGLYLARSVSRVNGIEENSQAVNDARINARLNQIPNASFLAGSVEKALVNYPERALPLVTVDPPRCGLNQKVIRRLARLSPRKIVYVSCNISSLARDTILFRDHGYHLRRIGFIDLFPQTPHFEAVSLFTP